MNNLLVILSLCSVTISCVGKEMTYQERVLATQRKVGDAHVVKHGLYKGCVIVITKIEITPSEYIYTGINSCTDKQYIWGEHYE